MNEREKFQAAVLTDCASRGLDAAQTLTVVKLARERIAVLRQQPEILKQACDQVGELVKQSAVALTDIPLYAGIAALAAPPVIGYGGGALAAHLADMRGDESPEDFRVQELYDEYRRNAELLRKRKKRYRMPSSV